MKRNIVNFGAVIGALIIGICINNACADSIDTTENMSDSELRRMVKELKEEVISLNKEVASLNEKVAKLENGSNNNGNTGSSIHGFVVDGISFSEVGVPDHKIDYVEICSYSINNGIETLSYKSTNRYKYDDKGRLINIKSDNEETKYTYGKKTYTMETMSDNYHSKITYYLK